MICKNPECKNEFKPKRSRQIFCCVPCQKKFHNAKQFEEYRSQRLATTPTESICPKCRKRHTLPNAGKWRFCPKCEELIIKYGITDTQADEYRVAI